MYDLNGAAIFSALFPLANDGARAWTLGAWLDTHRREVRVVADRAINTVAADIAAERIEEWLRVELPQRRKRHASGAAQSLTWALRNEAMRQRAGLEGARRAVHALGGDDTFDPRDEDAHYDVKRLIERYGADDPPEEEEEADPRPADAESAYYVSAVKGSSWVALAGPFETHREAINAKAEARRQARAKYPRDFDFADIAVGTVRAPRGQNVVLPALQPVAPVPVKASTLPGGFDSFDDDEEEPPASWQHAARMALTAQMGEGEVTPVSSFLRDGETLLSVEPLAYRFSARVSVHELDRAVLLFAPTVRNEADAEKIVGAFRRKLVARTKATNAAWFAHLARIVIASPAGSWNFDAEPDPASAPRMRGEGDTVTAQKERLIVAAQQAFGRGVTITGNNEKGYTLHISPTTKKHKWGAASLRFGHDFDTAHAQLAEAIRRMNKV